MEQYPPWYYDYPEFNECFTNQSIIQKIEKEMFNIKIMKYLKGQFIIQVNKSIRINKLKQEASKQFEVDPNNNQLKLFQIKLQEQKTIGDYDIKQNDQLLLVDPQEQQNIVDQVSILECDNNQYQQLIQEKPRFIFTYSGNKSLQAESNKKFKNIDEIRELCKGRWDLRIQDIKQINFFYDQLLIYQNFQFKQMKNLLLQSQFMVILDSEGGNLLKYNQIINSCELANFKNVVSEINLNNSQQMCSQIQQKIPQKYKQQQEYIALYSYTTKYLYRTFNQDMRKNNYIRWQKYLKLINNAFFKLKRHIGITYRGFKNTIQYNHTNFTKGIIYSQNAVTSSSLKYQKAKSFCYNYDGTILEIHGTSGRKLEDCTIYKSQQEVIFLPYTYFKVMDIVKQQSNHHRVILKQIPSIRGNKILFWVDDQPKKNASYIEKAEKQFGYTVILVTSTEQAIFALQKFQAILNFRKNDFRFITDMVRLEGKQYNYYAGIQFIQYVYKKKCLTTKVCIFCGDKKKALQNCEKRGLTTTQYNFIVQTAPSKLFEFIKAVKI